MLITLHQFQLMVPDTLVSYVFSGTLIQFESFSVPVSDITGLMETPHHLLIWDSSSGILQVSQQVIIIIIIFVIVLTVICIRTMWITSDPILFEKKLQVDQL